MNSAGSPTVEHLEGSNRRRGLLSWREAFAYVAVAILIGLGFALQRPSRPSNDSYQYLTVAANLRKGLGLETSLIHFDSERAGGRVPAPMTTFAPGFPVAIALTSFIAGNFERAAESISILASALAILPLCALAGFIGLDRTSTRMAVALLVGNAFYLKDTTVVLTEPLFLLVSIAALFVVSSSIESPASNWGVRMAIGQVLVAASYSVRYAGVFVFAAVLLHSVLRLMMLRDRRSLLYFLSNAISVSLMGTIMLRNILLTGTWKGGNTKPVNHPLSGVLAEYVRSHLHLLSGMHVVDFWQILLVIASGAAIIRGAVTVMRSRPSLAAMLPSGGCLLVCYGLLATAALIYLGKTSDISFSERMFYPLVPLYIVGALKLVQGGTKSVASSPSHARLRVGLAVAFVVLYLGVNLREFLNPESPSAADQVQAQMLKPMANGQPLLGWIDANIGRNETIAADNGQAVGYVLQRPTLSLIEAEYSTVNWDQEMILSQMNRFHARYLILDLGTTAKADPVKTESSFLAGAVCCGLTPGFHVAAENQSLKVLEIGDR